MIWLVGNNTTNETHQPWQTDSQYKPLSDAWVAQYSYLYLSDEIPAQEPSTPAYDVATPGGVSKPDSWTVYYYCKTHPNRESEARAQSRPRSQRPAKSATLSDCIKKRSRLGRTVNRCQVIQE